MSHVTDLLDEMIEEEQLLKQRIQDKITAHTATLLGLCTDLTLPPYEVSILAEFPPNYRETRDFGYFFLGLAVKTKSQRTSGHVQHFDHLVRHFALKRQT